LLFVGIAGNHAALAYPQIHYFIVRVIIEYHNLLNTMSKFIVIIVSVKGQQPMACVPFLTPQAI